ncbi:MAG: hypothetical protein KDB94_02450 [Acidobacteria bacterium]|nr:hypothetical protein [Acidobacteriota bacterium]
MPRFWRRRLFLALATGALVASVGVAAETPAQPEGATRMAALMERLTVEQRQAVEEFQTWIAGRSDSHLTGTLADGRKVGRAGGDAMQTMMTRRNADGTFTTRCIESAEEYALFLLGELDAAPAPGVLQATE